MLLLSLLSLLATTVPAHASLQIVPGATWTSTNTGVHIQAHGAGITKVGNNYYLIGEDKTNGTNFQNVNCYSSTDLVQWTYVGALLSQESSGDLGPNRIVERPKVIYNANTKQYVLYMHIDSLDYSEAKVGVATSSSVCGKYSYRGSFQPLGFQSRDMNLFQDTNGEAYLLSEDRANGLRIDALSSDYLSVVSSTYMWPQPGNIEAPAMIKQNGVYFMFGSHLSGWSPNDNVYSTATNLSGPWSSWQTFATPVGSQVMYMGDRWLSNQLFASTYIWLPLQISGTTASMSNYVNWVPSTFTGGPSEDSYEGEGAVLSNGAVVNSCTNCSAAKSAGYLGGPSNGTVFFASVQSSAKTKTTIRIDAPNGDASQRFSLVSVNGAKPQTIAFLPSADSNTPLASVAHLNLNSGGNTITIYGVGSGGWAADVDRIQVPTS